MANIQTRTTADNRVMYTARIRIKGFPQQTATFSRLTDAKQWVQKTEVRIREGMHFSKAEAKRHTFTEMVQRYTRTVLTNKSATKTIFASFGIKTSFLFSNGDLITLTSYRTIV